MKTTNTVHKPNFSKIIGLISTIVAVISTIITVASWLK